MKIDKVLDEYRQGDADKRMSLVLYHRALRDAFDRIEQEHPLDLFAVAESPQVLEKGTFCTFAIMLRELFPRFGSRASFDRTEQ